MATVESGVICFHYKQPTCPSLTAAFSLTLHFENFNQCLQLLL